jgi:gamma-glutamyltranspeptidase / glutathione hydrolase
MAFLGYLLPLVLNAADLPPELCTFEVRGRGGVVVANTASAAEAGARMLRSGGNAVDAAVAASFALGVSETEASGIGGSAWLLIHLADGRDVAIDGSAEVPFLAATEGRRYGYLDPVSGLECGYRMVATPGGLAAVQLALDRYGTKTLAETLAPAIELADAGVTLPPHEMPILEESLDLLRGSPSLAQVFLTPSLGLWDSSHVYCMDDLARTLRRLARAGSRDFYAGDIADEIDADMRANRGYLRKEDLRRVRAVERAPLRGSYRGLDVVAFPAPGAGAAVIEELQILEQFPSSLLTTDSVERIMLLVEAAALAIADLGQGRRVPMMSDLVMISPEHARRRASLIRLDRALLDDEVGQTTFLLPGGTTHVSVVDAQGNAVGLTQTFNVEYGASVATPGLGFPYNGSLSMYDWADPGSPSYPRLGTVLLQPIAPTMVLKAGKPMLVLGTPGSTKIPSAVVNVIVNVVDRGMDLASAVAAPRVLWGSRRDAKRVTLEIAGGISYDMADEVFRRGFDEVFLTTFPPDLEKFLLNGSVNTAGIDLRTGETVGAGDPRRSGLAVVGLAPTGAIAARGEQVRR